MELCRGLACAFGVLALFGCPAETTSGEGGSPVTGPECEEDADCPKGECESATCNSGACATAPLEDGVVVELQLEGDCSNTVCDGAGGKKQVPNEEDTPTQGGTCVTYSCGPSGLVITFNNGVKCAEDENRYCLENPEEDDPDNYECVECGQDSHCDTGICDEQEGNCAPATCGNGLLDGNETSEDCGGNDCPSCANGLACEDGGDCLSNNCNDGVCEPNDN